MGAVTAALIAIAAVALGWLTIEIACKPCLESGRGAIDRNLNPDYDPDDETLDAPLNPNNNESDDSNAAASSTVSKAV
ncbi:outer envelope membrane protein 7 [Primulina huaijiensis]|uniref:outer envelope membrane protein 7 n=1 Tax=Primulina huaijiensis TaxID=1492673 RepID=UPI003CC71FC5